jgi:putative pyruvate formate lyase activating enzyme
MIEETGNNGIISAVGSETGPSSIGLRAEQAWEILENCRLCPRKCGVNRRKREKGYCRAGPKPRVAAILPHLGEEPPITGANGAGTIFFSDCNMRCVYCQNHQISHDSLGKEFTARDLALGMMDLQEKGCSCIEPVSPSHHLPGLLEALAIAREMGLHLPVVYNTNGYEAESTLDLLDSIVDIYLPDLRYSDDAMAMKYSDAPGYTAVARAAILRMWRQVGDLTLDENGLAKRGIIIRLLVMPNNVAGVRESLYWIKENLSDRSTLSLMSQYSPLFMADRHFQLSVSLPEQDYEEMIDLCWDLGFENVFIQDYSARDMGIPDFESSAPFDWDMV